jgi:hypothetical protein
MAMENPCDIFYRYDKYPFLEMCKRGPRYNQTMSNDLPRWKCHKEVEAFKIESITMVDAGHPFVQYELAGDGCKITVSGDYLTQFRAKVGGYFVRYDNDYLSFSPPEPFEDGYKAIKAKKSKTKKE